MSSSRNYVPRHRASSAPRRRGFTSLTASRRYTPRHGTGVKNAQAYRVAPVRSGRHARTRPSAVSARQVVLTVAAVLLAVPGLASLGGPAVRAAMESTAADTQASVLAGSPVQPRVVGPGPVVPDVGAEPAAGQPSQQSTPSAGSSQEGPSRVASPSASPTPVPRPTPTVSPQPSPSVTASAGPSRDSNSFTDAPLAVTGDSIAVMLAEAWPGQVPVVEAQVGISSAASAQVLVPLLSSLDDSGLTVVALGTNDGVSTSAAFAETVRKVVAAAPGCVAWLTVHREQNGQTWEPFNDVLRASARNYARLVLVDWNALALSMPEVVYPDGIHPTPSGVRQLADMVAQAARSCPST